MSHDVSVFLKLRADRFTVTETGSYLEREGFQEMQDQGSLQWISCCSNYWDRFIPGEGRVPGDIRAGQLAVDLML